MGCTRCQDQKSFVRFHPNYEDDPMKIIISFHEGVCCDENLNHFFAQWEDAYARDRRFQILFDATRVSLLIPPRVVSRLVTFMRSHDDQTKKNVPSVAVVVTNDTTRKLINGILSAKKKRACPVQLFADGSAARQFLSKTK